MKTAKLIPNDRLVVARLRRLLAIALDAVEKSRDAKEARAAINATRKAARAIIAHACGADVASKFMRDTAEKK